MAAGSSVAKWLVGAGLALLGTSLFFSLAMSGRLGVGVLPGFVAMGLAGAGAIVAFRRGAARPWGFLGSGGALLGLAGAIAAIVGVAGNLRKAQVAGAEQVLGHICKAARHWADEGFSSGRRDGVGMAAAPMQFTSGRSGPAGERCCPRERCQGRTFHGSPWQALGMEGAEIPSPWAFEMVATGLGEGAVIAATADLACDGALTRVSRTITIRGFEVSCGPVAITAE